MPHSNSPRTLTIRHKAEACVEFIDEKTKSVCAVLTPQSADLQLILPVEDTHFAGIIRNHSILGFSSRKTELFVVYQKSDATEIKLLQIGTLSDESDHASEVAKLLTQMVQRKRASQPQLLDSSSVRSVEVVNELVPLTTSASKRVYLERPRRYQAASDVSTSTDRALLYLQLCSSLLASSRSKSAFALRYSPRKHSQVSAVWEQLMSDRGAGLWHHRSSPEDPMDVYCGWLTHSQNPIKPTPDPTIYLVAFGNDDSLSGNKGSSSAQFIQGWGFRSEGNRIRMVHCDMDISRNPTIDPTTLVVASLKRTMKSVLNDSTIGHAPKLLPDLLPTEAFHREVKD